MRRAGVLAALLALSGCNSVLGIDKAALEDDPTSCDHYCNLVMANCTDVNAEYISRDVCMAMCPKFDRGSPGDQSGDSRACRIYHATAAADDPATHCRHAGPLGYPACQPNPCQPFCLLDLALCGQQTSPPYPDEVSCTKTCEGGADAGYGYLTTGGASDINHTNDNTLNCRLYHLESAYNPDDSTNPGTHCPHTAAQSAFCK
jgi:hypothetical protein